MSEKTKVQNNIPTLVAADLSYAFETVSVNYPQILPNELDKTLSKMDRKIIIPENLEYLDRFYDAPTGTSGTAFRVKGTEEIILAYTGTNPNSSTLSDNSTFKGNLEFANDVTTDIVDIGMGHGKHYPPAFDFYEELVDKYGAENIVLTGHSLGGNIAQRVAIKYDVPTTVVYNAAPLYVPVASVVGNSMLFSLNGLAGLSSQYLIQKNVYSIQEDISHFTGTIKRIVTSEDPLTKYSKLGGGVVVGDEFVLSDSGGHGLQEILSSDRQLAELDNYLSLVFNSNEYKDVESNLVSVISDLVDLKEKWGLGNGPISSAQSIFLDASQAMAVSKGLSQVALQGENEVKTLSAELISQLEDNYSKTNQTYGTSLTPSEIRSVLAEAGANHYNLVAKYREKASQHEQVMAELSQQFSSLENQLHSGISETVALDQELGGLFAQ